MSGVTRPGGDPRPATDTVAGGGERAAAKPKSTEFDEVVRAKAEGHPRPRRAAPGAPTDPSQRIETTRDEAARSSLREHAQGSEAHPDPGGGLARREVKDDGAFSAGGGVAGPSTGVPGKPVEEVHGPDLAARVDEIARRIVEVAEVQLGPKGGAEVRLELSLHGLGHLRVTVARGDDGGLRLGFESGSERVAELVKNGAAELRTALETRGIGLESMTVKGPEGPMQSLQAPSRAEAPEIPRVVVPPRSGEEAAFGRGGEDRERRRRPDMPDDEENV